MPTTVLNAISKAYPLITNRIRAAVSKESSPLSIVAFIIDATAGHPQRTWAFPGLIRDNYRFSLDEIDGSGNPINNLVVFDVVPGEIDGKLVRDDEQIQVNSTVGFVGGATSFTFDGTSGKPDYVGWNIVPSELTGRGILVRGIDYSWDMVAGTFSLLTAGDKFSDGTWYNIHFDPQNTKIGGSVSDAVGYGVRLVTTDSAVTPDDFLNKILVEPSSNYLALTLPDIVSISDGKEVIIEIGKVDHACCVKLATTSGQVIKFGVGDLYMLPNESLSIYKYTRSGTGEWRVANPKGNFLSVGGIVEDFLDYTNVTNKVMLNGTVCNILTHARLYNQVVLLKPSSVPSYLWPVAKTQFSLADISGNFFVPDLSGLYSVQAGIGDVSGTYLSSQNKQHSHRINGDNQSSVNGGGAIIVGNPRQFEFINDSNNGVQTIENQGGAVARPETVIVNKYVLI